MMQSRRKIITENSLILNKLELILEATL